MKRKKGAMFGLVGLAVVAAVGIGAYFFYVVPNQIKDEAIAYAKKTHNQTVTVKSLDYDKFSGKEWAAVVAIKEFPDVEYSVFTKNGKKIKDSFGSEELEELIAQVEEKNFTKKDRSLIDTQLIDGTLVTSDISVPLENDSAAGVEVLQNYRSFTQQLAKATKDLTFEATISNGVKSYTLADASEEAITETIDSLYALAPYLVKKDSLKLSESLKKFLKEQGYTEAQLEYTKSSGASSYFASLTLVYDNYRKDNIDNQESFDPEDLIVEKNGKKYYSFEKQQDEEYTADQGLALTKELIKEELSVYEVVISFTSGSYGSQDQASIYLPISIKEPLSVTEAGGIYGGMLSADTTNPYGLDSTEYHLENIQKVTLPEPFQWVTNDEEQPVVLSDYTKSGLGIVLSYEGTLEELAEEIPELNKKLGEEIPDCYALIMIDGSPVSYYFQTTNSQPNYQLYKLDQAIVSDLLTEASVKERSITDF